MQSNVKLKPFRGDNGVYKAAEFRAELTKNDQRVTFCGTDTHHQNGIAEKYTRTMVEKTRLVLLNAHARWPYSIDMELWTFAFRLVVTQWNITPRANMTYVTPDEKFNGFEKHQNEDKYYFKHFHPF